MNPFYEQDGITIYHGDCREILPQLPKVDLVLTDPPYGIGRDGKPPSTSSHGGHKGYEFKGWDSEAPEHSTFKLLISKGRDWVIWGANYFAPSIPPGSCWLIWDKGQRIDQADAEIAATSKQSPIRIATINRVALQKDGAVHPTQKPLKLIRWCVSFFPDAETILDPFMGSGTTLLAAKLEGRKAIGIEINEAYCEIAANRLRQKVMYPPEMATL